MAKGRPASPNARNKSQNKPVEVEESSVDAPELRNRSSYSEETQAWWDDWASSPQASSFLVTDWNRLQMLAPLVELYWESQDPKYLVEIRLNEEKLGATIRDRQNLKMQVKPPKKERVAEPSEELPNNVTRLQDAFGARTA